jgi:hypothetical protein
VQLLRVTAELAEIGLDISREFPKPLTTGKPLTTDKVQAACVVSGVAG